LGLALLQDASSATAAAAIIMYFFIVVVFIVFFLYSFFFISLFRDFGIAFLADRIFALASHLPVLVHDAVDTPLAHGFTVMNMLRTERSVLEENQFDAEKYHADSNY
jgi:hypothetical protein